MTYITNCTKQKLLPVLLVLGMLAVFCVSALLIVRSAHIYEHYFGLYYDDAIYATTAEALAEQHSYRLISLPGEPPQGKYPIGLPLILSFVWSAFPRFPQNLVVLTAVQAFAAILMPLVAVMYLIRTRKVTPGLGLVIVSLCLLNYNYLDFAPVIMTDLPASLLVFIALWITERYSRGKYSIQKSVLLGIATALPCLIRLQCLTLAAAQLAYLSYRKRFRLAAVSLLSASVIIVPDLLWQARAARQAPSFLAYYTGYYAHFETLASWNLWLPHVERKAASLLYLLTDIVLPLLQVSKEGTSNGLVVYLLIPLLLGFLRDIRKGSLLGLFVILNFLLLSFDPLVFRIDCRHVLAFLPIAYYMYICGLRLIAKHGKPKELKWRHHYQNLTATVSLTLCLTIVLAELLQAISMTGAYGFTSPFYPACGAEIYSKDRDQAFAWIRDHTLPTDVFVYSYTATLFLHTHRKAISPSRLEPRDIWEGKLIDQESLANAIQFARASYVVEETWTSSMNLSCARAVKALADKNPNTLSPAYQSEHGLIKIFKINPILHKDL